MKLFPEMEPHSFFQESHCNLRVNPTRALKIKRKSPVLSIKFHSKHQYLKFNWKRKAPPNILIPTFTKLNKKISWAKWESNPELLTSPWKSISVNLSLKAKFQKEVTASFTKGFGVKQPSLSKCLRSSLKTVSKISSVNVQPWKPSDIQTSWCFLELAQNLQISRLYWSTVEKGLCGQQYKI